MLYDRIGKERASIRARAREDVTRTKKLQCESERESVRATSQSSQQIRGVGSIGGCEVIIG